MLRKKAQKGFTLVEMLVSAAIFVVVCVVAIGAIITVIDVNKKSQSLTSVMNDLNFGLESITRTIKTAESVSVIGSGYKFKDQKNREVEFKAVKNRIQRCIKEVSNPEVCIDMTSDQTEVDSFTITMLPTDANNASKNLQPRFLLNITGTANVGPKISSKFEIQTTVSPRKVNFNNQLFK